MRCPEPRKSRRLLAYIWRGMYPMWRHSEQTADLQHEKRASLRTESASTFILECQLLKVARNTCLLSNLTLPQSVLFCYSCQTWLTHAHYTLKSVILWPTPGYLHNWQDLETWFLDMLFSNPGCTLWRPITILLAHAQSLTTNVRQVLYRCGSQETQEELAWEPAPLYGSFGTLKVSSVTHHNLPEVQARSS